MEQMTLAEAATNEAVRRVAANADPAWMTEARSTIRAMAFQRRYFTTDDLWSAGLRQPHEPRALGAVMREAARAGICEPTDRYQRSNRPACHTRPLRVWRSLLYPTADGGAL